MSDPDSLQTRRIAVLSGDIALDRAHRHLQMVSYFFRSKVRHGGKFRVNSDTEDFNDMVRQIVAFVKVFP